MEGYSPETGQEACGNRGEGAGGSHRPRGRRLGATLTVLVLGAAACDFGFASFGPRPTVPLDVPVTWASRDAWGEWPSDPVDLRRLRVVRDTLVATVSYAGGCQDHRFHLLLDPHWGEGSPPFLEGRIAHDARGDACRALLQQELVIALAPVRDRYRQLFGPGGASVEIRLEARAATYSFPE